MGTWTPRVGPRSMPPMPTSGGGASHKAYADRLKATSPCADCGRYFPAHVMQWDHRPGTKKVMGISEMIRSGTSFVRLKDELAKCDPVCANCHATRTYQRSKEAHARDTKAGLVGVGSA